MRDPLGCILQYEPRQGIMIKYFAEIKAAGVPISFAEIVGMWLRKSLSAEMTRALVTNHVLRLGWPVEELEAHSLAGGDLSRVMIAASSLKSIKEPYDKKGLMLADLAKMPIDELVEAFNKIRTAYPNDLGFNELLVRFLDGEDVIAAIKKGTFLPQTKQSDWMVRAEIGPLSAPELYSRIENGGIPDNSQIYDPVRQDWISVDVAKTRLRDHSR